MEKKEKFNKIMIIALVVIVIVIAIITTCILNSKQRERDELNKKNEQIENLVKDDAENSNSAQISFKIL